MNKQLISDKTYNVRFSILLAMGFLVIGGVLSYLLGLNNPDYKHGLYFGLLTVTGSVLFNILFPGYEKKDTYLNRHGMVLFFSLGAIALPLIFKTMEFSLMRVTLFNLLIKWEILDFVYISLGWLYATLGFIFLELLIKLIVSSEYRQKCWEEPIPALTCPSFVRSSYNTLSSLPFFNYVVFASILISIVVYFVIYLLNLK